MGLHNRYPSYFYKRGNLFNTYLGYADAQGPVPTRPKRSAGEPTRELGASPAVRLLAYARKHLSPAEARAFLTLIAAKHTGGGRDFERTTDAQLPAVFESFVFEHVPPSAATKYLAELKRRRLRGEPLIQK